MTLQDIVLNDDVKFKDGLLHLPETGTKGLYFAVELPPYFIPLEDLRDACYSIRRNEWKKIDFNKEVMVNESGCLLVRHTLFKVEVLFSAKDYKTIKAALELV